MAFFHRNSSSSGIRMLVSGHRSEWLVGTEHYPRVYSRGREGQSVVVELVPETANVNDPDAIAGVVDGNVAGYLKRELALKYRKVLETASALGFQVVVQTEYRQRGGGDLGMGWLDIPSPEALKQWLDRPADERARGFDFPAGKSPNTPRAVGRPI